VKIFLGPPGTGKTTRLLSVVEQELSSGVRPHEIAFVAFTRKAAHEAKGRAMEKFGLQEDQLPFFRTLHSLAFRQLGLTPDEVLGPSDYAELGHSIGMNFAVATDDNEGLPTGPTDKRGSNCMYIDQIARLTQTSIQDVCVKLALERYWDVKLFCDTLVNYKLARKKVDFTDMMETFIDQGECPAFKVVIVDEAQDLTPIQWRIVERITGRAERVYIAGDDDQAIYEWAGADVQRFLDLKGEFVVLPHSFRLPRKVHSLALGVLTRIRQRFEKQFQPRDDDGSVHHYLNPEQVNYSTGSWLLLARNRYALGALCTLMRQKGHPFVLHGRSSVNNENVKALVCWEQLRKGDGVQLDAARSMVRKLRDGGIPKAARSLNALPPDELVTFEMLAAQGLTVPKTEDWMTALKIPDTAREYYRAIRRNKESLIATPRITVSTIHQAKGGEADNVLVSPDISAACYSGFVSNPDIESRVYYVAVTRARQALHIVQPRTNKFYELRVSA
jgi:DNA helicase-2/ATP-dependent DNA helicase PcrA